MVRKRKHSLDLKLVELEEGNFHLLVSGKIDGVHVCHWIIDTGASKSVFDVNQVDMYSPNHNPEQEIRSAGIGEGHIETSMGILENLNFGELIESQFHVALINFSHINELYSQFTDEEVHGLLGSDFLLAHQAVIDYRKLTLTLKG